MELPCQLRQQQNELVSNDEGPVSDSEDWNWDDPFILESRESDQEASKDQNIVDEATSTSNERWVEEICFHWVIVLTWHPNQSLEHQFFR